MRKKIILILCLVIFTGCDATYNLTIGDNYVNESSDFIYENNNSNRKIIDDYYKNKFVAFYDMNLMHDNFYSKKKINTGGKIGLNLSYTYENDDYQNSSLLDQCYYKKSFTKSDDYIILYTEGGASCFYKDDDKLLNSLTVNIKTDLKVVKNNADNVNGKTYTWKFNDENFSTKDIYIKIKRDKNKNGLLNGIIIFSLITLCLFVVGLIILQGIRIKNNKL